MKQCTYNNDFYLCHDSIRRKDDIYFSKGHPCVFAMFDWNNDKIWCYREEILQKLNNHGEEKCTILV